MNLNYSQASGLVTDDTGQFVAKGWAGCGDGKNNPAMQMVHETGPLPQGIYRVEAWGRHPRLGPLTARLIQIQGETFGRDAFYCHGPSSKNYGQESKGCIVIPRFDRERVAALLVNEGNTITVTP
jgi:hypothetical protein